MTQSNGYFGDDILFEMHTAMFNLQSLHKSVTVAIHKSVTVASGNYITIGLQQAEVKLAPKTCGIKVWHSSSTNSTNSRMAMTFNSQILTHVVVHSHFRTSLQQQLHKKVAVAVEVAA